MIARILGLHVKPQTPGEFGLPKQSVPKAKVSRLGMEGDYNSYRSRKLKGDPDQALLLFTMDCLNTLNREGWPVQPGDMGENITIDGVPESVLGPGIRLVAGTVIIEVTKACDPCDELFSLPYVGKNRGPEFLRTTAKRRGWYARVISGGELAAGGALEIV
jgi:MOSC domain-containing protein YiiM